MDEKNLNRKPQTDIAVTLGITDASPDVLSENEEFSLRLKRHPELNSVLRQILELPVLPHEEPEEPT